MSSLGIPNLDKDLERKLSQGLDIGFIRCIICVYIKELLNYNKLLEKNISKAINKSKNNVNANFRQDFDWKDHGLNGRCLRLSGECQG